MNKRVLAFSMAVMLFLLCLPIPVYAYGDVEFQSASATKSLAEKDSEEESLAPEPDDMPVESPESPAQSENNSKEETNPAEETEPPEPVPSTELSEHEEDEWEPVVVWGVLPVDVLDIFSLEVGGDVRTLSLPTVAYVQTGRFQFFENDITWRYECFDASTPGRRSIVGDVLLPEGYIYPDDELTVEYEVLVFDPATPTELIVSANFFITPSKIVIPLGLSDDELEQYFQTNANAAVNFGTANGDFFSCGLTYDLSVVETENAGSYHPFIYDLPPYAAFNDNESILTAVHVIDPDTVDMRGAYYAPHVGVIICSWFKEIAEPELWVSVDSGEWQAAPNFGEFYRNAALTASQVSIHTSALPPGHIYEFEVRYENDGYSVNSLCVDMTGDIPLLRMRDGDRHGYDRKPEGGGNGGTPPSNGDSGTDGKDGSNSGTHPGNGINGTGDDDGYNYNTHPSNAGNGTGDGDGNNDGTHTGNGGNGIGDSDDYNDNTPPGNAENGTSDGDGNNDGTHPGNAGNGTGDGDGNNDGNNDGIPPGNSENGTSGDVSVAPTSSETSGAVSGDTNTDKTVPPYDENIVPSKATEEEAEKAGAQLSSISVSSLTAPIITVQAQETNTPPGAEAPIAADDTIPVQNTTDVPVHMEPSDSMGEQVPRVNPLPISVPMVIGGMAVAGFAGLTLIGKRRVVK